MDSHLFWFVLFYLFIYFLVPGRPIAPALGFLSLVNRSGPPMRLSAFLPHPPRKFRRFEMLFCSAQLERALTRGPVTHPSAQTSLFFFSSSTRHFVLQNGLLGGCFLFSAPFCVPSGHWCANRAADAEILAAHVISGWADNSTIWAM